MSTPSPARTAGPAAPPAAVLPGAASASVRSLLTGAARPARLLADFGRVAYLDLDGDLLALSAPGAVRLPVAGTVTGPLPALVEPVLVGDGAIRAAGVTVRVRRWWRPPIPRAAAGPRGDHEVRRLSALAKGVEGHDRGGAPERRTGPDVAGRAAALELALVAADADATAVAVARLVGRGPGLTPAGDDVLAGALLAGHGTPLAAEVAAALPEDLTARTTALAAALVRAAARGEGTPEGVALVDAVRGHGELAPALDALLALGHSSGADTALGILVAARAAAARAEPGRPGTHQEDE